MLFVTVFVFFLCLTGLLLSCAEKKAVKEKSGKGVVGQVKILILFAQLLSSMSNVFDAVPWPSSFMLFATYFSLPFNLDFLAGFALGSCNLSLDPLDAFSVHMSTVPLLAAAVTASYLCTTKISCCVASTVGAAERSHMTQSRRELAIKTFIFTVQLMYPGLATRIFSILRCVKFDGIVSSILAKNLLVECHVGRHALYEGLSALFMVLYVIGVPFGVFMALWWNRKHLNDESSPKHNAVKYEYGALYRQFTPQFWYFGMSFSIPEWFPMPPFFFSFCCC